MVSRVFMICNSYESGYGHGFDADGLDLSKTPHSDRELGEAYQIGYEAGLAARNGDEAAMLPNTEAQRAAEGGPTGAQS